MVRKINAPIGAEHLHPVQGPGSHLSVPVFLVREKRQANRLSVVGASSLGGHVAERPNPLQLRPLVGRLRVRARQLGLLVFGIHQIAPPSGSGSFDRSEGLKTLSSRI